MTRSSLRLRLTLAFTLAIAVLLAVVCVGVGRFAQQQAARGADTLLQDTVLAITEELASPQHDPPGVILDEGRTAWSAEGLVVVVRDGAGVLTTSAPRPATAVGWRQMARSVGEYTVEAALYWEPTVRALERQQALLVGVSVGVVVLVGGGAWLLVGRALAPIARLAQQAAADTGTLRLTAPGTDQELVLLVETLNGFLERTEQETEARRLFHAAAAHELRTPLHVLSGQIELALGRPRTAAEYQEALAELQRQTGRLQALALGLLSLTRLERAPTSPTEPLDLSALCHAQLQLLQAGEIEVSLPPTWPKEAPRAELELVVRNLLDNALRHGRGTRPVRIERRGDALSLWNSGSLPPREALEGMGPGIGLALCTAVARRYRWTLTFTHADNGVRVELVLPDTYQEKRGAAPGS